MRSPLLQPPVLLALLLGACAPMEPPPGIPRPAADPGVGLPLRLVGTEPFWGVLLKDGALSFNGADRGAIVAPIAGREVEAGATVYRTAAPSARMPVSVRATITAGPCSDGMSDRVYPYAAAVDIDYAGAAPPVTLKGCAGPEALFERPPG